MQHAEKTLKPVADAAKWSAAADHSALAASIYNSQRMVAQRQQLRSLFGEVRQLGVRLESETSAQLQAAAMPTGLQAAIDKSPRMLAQRRALVAAFDGAKAELVQRRVKVTDVQSDAPESVAEALKDCKLPQAAFGVDTKATRYRRPQSINAVVKPGKTKVDKKGGATAPTTTAEIGGMGKLESLVFGYGPAGDYGFAGGHLVGGQYWTAYQDSLSEQNLVPMRAELNGSLYKIMESEVGAYVGGGSGHIDLEINCSYGAKKTVVLSNSPSLLGYLKDQGVEINDDKKFDKKQTISVEPRVPFKITAKVTTFQGSPDLPVRTFDTPGTTDVRRSETFGKSHYVGGVGWDATQSETLPTKSSANTVWRDFDPVRLKVAGARTYTFDQQAKP